MADASVAHEDLALLAQHVHDRAIVAAAADEQDKVLVGANLKRLLFRQVKISYESLVKTQVINLKIAGLHAIAERLEHCHDTHLGAIEGEINDIGKQPWIDNLAFCAVAKMMKNLRNEHKEFLAKEKRDKHNAWQREKYKRDKDNGTGRFAPTNTVNEHGTGKFVKGQCRLLKRRSSAASSGAGGADESEAKKVKVAYTNGRYDEHIARQEETESMEA